MTTSKLLAFAIVSAIALTSVHAMAESAVALRFENAWRSNQNVTQPEELSVGDHQRAQLRAAAEASDSAATPAEPVKAETSENPAKLEGAQPSFNLDGTAATRHHGTGTSGGTGTHHGGKESRK